MRKMVLMLGLALGAGSAVAAEAIGQEAAPRWYAEEQAPGWHAEEAAPAVTAAARWPIGAGSRPLLRTVATVGASAAGFAAARAYASDAEPDELAMPIVAGVAASTVAGWLFSDAPRAKVLVGSILGTVPASALARYLTVVLPEESQGQIPLVGFSVPHGLVTSAFAQRR